MSSSCIPTSFKALLHSPIKISSSPYTKIVIIKTSLWVWRQIRLNYGLQTFLCLIHIFLPVLVGSQFYLWCASSISYSVFYHSHLLIPWTNVYQERDDLIFFLWKNKFLTQKLTDIVAHSGDDILEDISDSNYGTVFYTGCILHLCGPNIAGPNAKHSIVLIGLRSNSLKFIQILVQSAAVVDRFLQHWHICFASVQPYKDIGLKYRKQCLR